MSILHDIKFHNKEFSNETAAGVTANYGPLSVGELWIGKKVPEELMQKSIEAKYEIKYGI